MTDVRTLVRAAGGVVCRPGPAGQVEVVVIHRPAQDDWTLPKGKLEPGETAEQAAVREVKEETGFEVRVLRPMGCVAYTDRRGREKVVFYWVMWAEDGSFTPNDEVDQLLWLTLAEAQKVLSYKADRALLTSRPLP